jgi:hypothetical protein
LRAGQEGGKKAGEHLARMRGRGGCGDKKYIMIFT